MLDLRAAAGKAKVARIPALDFTKGALVLFMVLYHWANYFIGPQWPYYRYLRFLTPSFIFITGFMISSVYLSRFSAGDPRLLKRLVVRGVKLIFIFVALNLVRDCALSIFSKSNMLPGLLNTQTLFAIFMTGNFNDKVVAFYILIPIAYLLILSGLFMIPLAAYKYTFHAVCICLFTIIGIVDMYGGKSQIIEIVAIGMLGILVGFIPIKIIDKNVRHSYFLALFYLSYTAAIARYNVPYPLEVVGTCLSVTIIYVAGMNSFRRDWISDKLTLLGKYSLFGYIAQIAILQALHAGLSHLNPRSAVLAISFSAALGLLLITVELIDRARSGSESIDRLYKAVFN